VYIDISRSFVQCNLTPNAKDGTFKVVAASFSAFDQTFYEEANLFANLTPYDGAVLQLQALADTNLAYAQPFAVAAITDQGLQQSSSMYAPGYPVPTLVSAATEGCTASNLNPVDTLRYMRKTATPVLVFPGALGIEKVDGCQGNSGGPLIDEAACVAYGVFSAVAADCSAGISISVFSRIVADAATPGVNLPAIIAALKFGQTVLLPTPLPNSPVADIVASANDGYSSSGISVSTDGGSTFTTTYTKLDGGGQEVQFVAVAVSAIGVMVAAVDMGGQNSGGGYIYISRNFGNSFTAVTQVKNLTSEERGGERKKCGPDFPPLYFSSSHATLSSLSLSISRSRSLSLPLTHSHTLTNAGGQALLERHYHEPRRTEGLCQCYFELADSR